MKTLLIALVAIAIVTKLPGQSERAAMRFDNETGRWVFAQGTVSADSAQSLPYMIGHDIIFGKENGSQQLGEKAEGIRLIKLSQEYGGIEAAILLAKLHTEGRVLPTDHSLAEKLLIEIHPQLTKRRLNDEESSNPRQTGDAESGDLKAQVTKGLFGYCESYGEDRKESVKWLLRAAKQGSQRAQLALGVVYLKGELIPKNQLEAYKWLLLADTEKDDLAGRYMARFDDISHTLIAILENRMTKEQIAEGQRAASEFKAVDEVKAKEAAELAEVLKKEAAQKTESDLATNTLHLWWAIAFLGLCVVFLYAKRK